jgi:hypothetical protein
MSPKDLPTGELIARCILRGAVGRGVVEEARRVHETRPGREVASGAPASPPSGRAA